MRRFRARRLTAAVAGAITVVLGVAAPATAGTSTAPRTAGPGAAGIGDPYYPDYGNGGYHVSHYDLHLRYQPGDDHLDGTATLVATATQDLTQFDLDFALTTSSVLVNNRPAKFARSGDHELVVTPDRTIRSGTPMTIVVTYSGVPSQVKAGGFTAWIRTHDGAVAVGEPEIAWWWFPSNDHPLDKATFDIAVAVPDGNQVTSNGQLMGSRSQLGWTTYRWRETRPMATYLATMAVGHYDVHTDSNAAGLPVLTSYSTGLGNDDGAARASVGRTGEVIDWESSVFGPYPFEEAGGVVPDVPFGFSLENQTKPTYSRVFFDQGANLSVVVHENAHQWFGDDVSVHHWQDIWLNEGFATYAQWLWSEHAGEGTAQQVALYTYNQIPATDPLWSVKPGDPGPKNQFSDAVYDRGGMALQALRNTVGDDAFFRILRTWVQAKQGGNGTVKEFTDLAQLISGKDLGQLFQTWLYTTTKPPVSAFNSPPGFAPAAVAQPKSWPTIHRTTQLLTARH